MDRRSWPWKKKSSDKADKVAVANAAAADAAAAALASTGSKVDQDNDKKPNYVKISVESYTHLTGLEDQVKAYEEQVQSLDGQVQELDEKLSAAHSEMTTKENTVKQHAKVAEEAVSGWEKAEAEALALKNHLEAVTLSKLTAEDRASHLDGALKECMWQIRNLKEEHECKLQEVILLKTKQWDKIRIELEAKMGNLDQELLKVVAENTAISRSLQERSNMLIKISEEKSQVEAEIEFLKSNIESCEREINSLKYELHVVSKELEIRNEEKNMSMRSAEVANKHHMEGVKKIAKLEAECQRLRGLVRKKLPGPAALAQMKLEVENLGRDYGETRNKRSPVKPSSAHLSPVTEFSLDNLQKFQKENEFLAEHLLAMEEETKMLKEALAKRNGELQASRNLCAKTASKLQSLEGQLQISDQQKNYSSHNASNPPSITSMSEDGNDDERSCADSWATAMISELSQFKKENNNEKSKRAENVKHLELMDDFLEMEKLACLSNDSNTNGAITVSDSSNNKISVNHVSEDPTSVKDSPLKQHLDLDPSADHASSDKGLSVVAFGNQADEVLATELQSRISMVFESLSRDTVWGEIEEDLKRIMQEAQGVKFQSSVNCASEEVHCSDAVGRHAELTSEMGVSLSEASNVATEIVHKPSQELTDAISQINDFILFLGKEAMIVPETSSDNNELSQKIAEFSVTFNKISCGSMLLDDFIFDLSHVLAKAGELRFNILGFKNGASEPNSPDCIDKVALPENKMVQKERSEMYQNGHALISSSTTDPEVPDDGNLVSSYKSNAKSIKFSLEEFEELRLEKDNMTTDLVRSAENLEMTKSKLYETEQLLAAANLQLAAAQRSNILAETQLKCMAESYRSLEARAEELETEVNLLRMKTETLENELQDEKRSCQDAVDRCNELQEQLQRNEGCSVCSSAADNGVKMKQDQEYSAATEKLAECQETIFLLGKQLKSLRPQTELIGSYTYNESSQRDEKQLKSLRPQTELMGSHTYNESSQRDEGFTEEKHTSSGMKLREFDQAEMDAPASANLQRVGAESPISSSSQFDAEVDFVRSPISSKYPNNRPTKSTSSSCSSTPTPEKQTRGFSRFFSSKGKNGP